MVEGRENTAGPARSRECTPNRWAWPSAQDHAEIRNQQVTRSSRVAGSKFSRKSRHTHRRRDAVTSPGSRPGHIRLGDGPKGSFPCLAESALSKIGRVGEPITTKYAGEIAYLTAAFMRQAPTFALHPALERTPWFL
jgi:hypothetical protein